HPHNARNENAITETDRKSGGNSLQISSSDRRGEIGQGREKVALVEVTSSQRLALLLDESPLKALQRWLWVLSTGGTLLDGFAIFALGVAIPLIIARFRITPDVVGLIGAALVFGAVLGAGIGGPVADRLGRRRLMLADMIIIAAGAATSALATGRAMLFVGQLIVGVGIGIDFPVSSSYLSEVVPKRSRAR